jgi:putative ABC transport system permease protein
MDTFFQDLRYALRTFTGTPGFTAVAIATLALGIGANSAIFTLVNAVLIERLPFKDPSRLVALWEESARRPGRNNTVGPGNYIRWQERATSFERMSAFADGRSVLTGSGDPEEVTHQLAIGPLFEVLGVAALHGRTFNDIELSDDSVNAAVLSHAFWTRRFGADPTIVGRTIVLNGSSTTVVGVMPPDVRLLYKSNSQVGKPTDLWRNFPFPPSARTPRGRSISVIARLKPQVTIEQARAEMKTIAANLATEFPDFDTGWTAKVVPLRDELAGELRPALIVLAGAVAFVLLIACANVANLLLARGAGRQREVAIRTALGAARGRVIRQLLTEAMMLGIAGGLVGLVVARWSLDLLIAISPVDVSQLGHVALSYPVLAFTAVISLLTAVVCGLAPALEGARTDVHDSLKDGGRQIGGGVRHRRLRQAFVVAEVALAVVLLVGAGLMLRTFASLRSVDAGLDTHRVLTARVSLPGRKYNAPTRTLAFYREAVGRLAATSGVESVGVISYLPFAGLGAGTNFSIVGQPPQPRGEAFVTDVSVVDNGYFSTMRIALKRGRLFTAEEMTEKKDVVIVNEALAAQYFRGRDPIGQRVVINMTDPNVPTEIIGIVANSKFLDLRSDARPASYWPHPQLPYTAMTFAVRTAGDPLTFASAVGSQIHAIDKDQPLSDVRTMDQWIAKSLAQARFTSLILAVFAGVALLLAWVGIYGVMSYAVTQRTGEIGVRVALGAERGDILRLIVATGGKLAAIGLGIGVVLALALTRTITSLLYDVASTDPLTLSAVVITLAAVALLASYLPARRASRIAPTEALRYQ